MQQRFQSLSQHTRDAVDAMRRIIRRRPWLASACLLVVGMAGGVGGFLLAAGLGVVKQHAGSYAPGLWAFAAIALAASLCLVGVKQRWRLHWAAAGAARV